MRLYSCSALIVAFTFAFSGHTALPDLSDEQREAQAAYIIEGTVTSVLEEVKVKNEGWSDYIYTVQMDVTHALKAKYPPPPSLVFHFWKAAKRPEGLCGDMGQRSVIHAGQRVRVYTREAMNGGQKLLKPNGWEMLPEEPLYVINFPG